MSVRTWPLYRYRSALVLAGLLRTLAVPCWVVVAVVGGVAELLESYAGVLAGRAGD